MSESAHTDATRLSSSIQAMIEWDEGESEGHTLYLQAHDTVQIGRDRGNQIVLTDPGISRNHAVIVWRDDHFEISDLGSTNGTRINQDLTDEPRRLHDGDTITLYQTELRFYDVSLGTQDDGPQAAPAVRPGREPTFVVLPTAPRPRLIVSAGSEEGREIILAAGVTRIGRATSRDSWDISLQDRAISRPHAQLERQDGEFILTDLGSVNGTRVNGSLIEEPATLQDGDVIVMGETTLLYRAL